MIPKKKYLGKILRYLTRYFVKLMYFKFNMSEEIADTHLEERLSRLVHRNGRTCPYHAVMHIFWVKKGRGSTKESSLIHIEPIVSRCQGWSHSIRSSSIKHHPFPSFLTKHLNTNCTDNSFYVN